MAWFSTSMLEWNQNMTKNVRQIVCENAALELSEQHRKSWSEKKKGISEKTFENPFFFKKVVSLIDEPISIEHFKNFDENIRTTGGYYTLTYRPTTSCKYVKGKPYCIGQDLLRLSVNVSGVRHWHCLAQRIPELAWLDRWSTLTDALFALAKKHPDVPFGFTVKWLEYSSMIEEKAEKMGIDIDHKAFVVYAAKESLAKEINETHLMAPYKTKEDYKSVLDEVDQIMKDKEAD